MRKEYFNEKKCAKCEMGQYQDEPGQDKCKECTEGHKCSKAGLSKAELCDRNYFSDERGQTVCYRCTGGWVSPPGSRSCGNPCTKGEALYKTCLIHVQKARLCVRIV